MERTKVFVSYSHLDRDWLERLSLHLALLTRLQLVEVWSDIRIEIGGRWRDEIDKALTTTRVAVLLVSPGFLASDFIWRDEMPLILAHQEKGMTILPLIARPCAWKIAPQLADLQASPAGGRPLSLATEAEADRDLAEFVYALAAKVQQFADARAAAETEASRQLPTAADQDRSNLDRAVATKNGTTRPVESAPLTQSWSGLYSPTNRRLQLVLKQQGKLKVSGIIRYLDDETVTTIEGSPVQRSKVLADPDWKQIRSRLAGFDLALVFAEKEYQVKGSRPPNLNGKYRAVVAGDSMALEWVGRNQPARPFDLKRD